ncbi:hypothetical protein BTJ39_14070 [Izhakiella australiensis]|uniref:Inner membrane lipoprotein DcrB n=1 Tax=Izhakiella australiensis TaxID=1926881 RepID=A0A1S8YK06_9GAMM|nr:DcrB family lipoprotein [Izhakiella australiensis]OON39401.1 hypothetical protein BTJ39_14070 [Izhakiella australiensis]
MRNLLKYAGIGLLVVGLAACDGKNDKTGSESGGASSSQSAQNVSLLDGKLSFTLPEGMSDKSDKLATQASNMHVYADDSQQRTIIVLVGDNSNQNLDVFAKRLENEQRNRDPQLQVISNKALTLSGHEAQELNTVISANNQTSWSSIILAKLDDKVITMQISLPADNQQQAQSEAQKVVDSIKLK